MRISNLCCACILLLLPFINLAYAESINTSPESSHFSDIALVSNSRVAVTRADFEAEIERVPEKDRFEFLASRERVGKLVEDILVRKTLVSEAIDAGLDKQPKTIIKLAAAREGVLATERIANLEQTAKLPDFSLRAKEIYRINPDKYTVKSTVAASHILINSKDRSKDEALKRAQEVYTLAASGGDFGELAEKYSDDKGSKTKKGDLGYFEADKMVKPFSDVAFAMKPGEISAPIETQFGYHVIKLVDVKPGYKQDFNEVKAAIIEELKAEYSVELRKNHLISIRTDKAIKINEEEMLKIKTTLPTIETK